MGFDIDQLTKEYLASITDDPAENLPEGWEYKFGLRGKFKRHASLQALEESHLEYDGNDFKPFAYTLSNWEEVKKVILPTDELWEVCGSRGAPIVWVIRNGEIVTKECPGVKCFIGGTTVIVPDPKYYFDLDCL
jgi:hypothetical protein